MLGANEYAVQFERNGKLYIERNGGMIKIANPFDHTPDTIELVQIENELYIKGFEPKKAEPKKAEPKKSKKSDKKKDK